MSGYSFADVLAGAHIDYLTSEAAHIRCQDGSEIRIAGDPEVTEPLAEALLRLAARCEAAERDAARYRWLRDSGTMETPPYVSDRRGGPLYHSSLNGDSLDAAIDAAMREDKDDE